MNTVDLIVFDFETAGKEKEDVFNIEKTIPLQIAAVAINSRSLKFGETFASYIKPTVPYEELHPEALGINKITKENVENAPDQKTVMKLFINYVNKHSKKPGSPWEAPIPGGTNILKYDIPILERLCKDHKLLKSDNVVFNKKHQVDLLNFLFPWFENNPDAPNSYRMDMLRTFFGLPSEGAHNAVVDVQQCAQIIVRFLQYHRNIVSTRNPQFRGCFAK